MSPSDINFLSIVIIFCNREIHTHATYKDDGTGVYGAGCPKKMIKSHTDNSIINCITEFSKV